MRRLAGRVAGLRGWRRLALAVVLGALAAAALPPTHVLPLLVVGFTALVWMLDGAETPKRAFVVGWAFGAGWFGAGLYWVANAFLVYPDKHAALMPLAIAGLGLGFGAQWGVAAWVARRLWRPGPGRIVVLAAALTAMEWVRGWLFTGFPWNWAGYVWDFSLAMLQPMAWIGALGLTLVTVIAAMAPATLADDAPPLKRWAPSVAMAAMLASLWIGGEVRLSGASNAVVPGVTLRLVQANISQRDKWRGNLIPRHLMAQAEMSRAEGAGPVTHVIWPETNAFYSLDHQDEVRAIVAAAAPPGGVAIVGAPRSTPPGTTPRQAWNSMFVVTADGRVSATYDKAHLVPFGEYMPLKDWLPLAKMTAGALDFSAGPGPRAVPIPGAPPASPLICYEVIFPAAVTPPDGPRPGWLLNLTNDGWYGISSGPYQHFAISRARAIEEGLPLVRAAGTGISGVIDPYGREIARLDLGVKGIADAPLPAALPATVFSRTGHAPILILLGLFLAGAAMSRTRNSL